MTIIAPATTQSAITEPIQQLLETVSLYVHIPFCHTRCHYCDFNTYAGMLPLREPYTRALLTEIGMAGGFTKLSGGKSRPSRPIFFCGGTPRLLSGSQVSRILDACYGNFAGGAGAR